MPGSTEHLDKSGDVSLNPDPQQSDQNIHDPLPLNKSGFTEPPESWHHVHKCSYALTVGLRQAGFEMVAQREQVVSQVHAVVVLNRRQMWELEQIFPGRQIRHRKTGLTHSGFVLI